MSKINNVYKLFDDVYFDNTSIGDAERFMRRRFALRMFELGYYAKESETDKNKREGSKT